MKRWYCEGAKLIRQMKETRLPDGMLAIWFLAQAGIVVKSGEALVGIDLYLENREGRAVPPPFAPEEAAGLFDVLLCTHNHLDHLDPVTVSGIAAAENAQAAEAGEKSVRKTRFVVPAPWTGFTEKLGVEKAQIIGAHAGQEITLTDAEQGTDLAGIRILPVRAAHEDFVQDENGDYECLGYVVRFPGGSLYHAGDTVEWETMAEELAPLGIDIACLPINGSDWKRKKADIIGNLNAREACDLSQEIGADLLIPMHYDVFAHNGENPAYLADLMWRNCPGAKYHFFAPGERYLYMK